MVNYKSKKYKFAITVDEYGKKKANLSGLLDLLKEEFSFLRQASRLITTKRINQAKKGNVIVFGFSKKYDFRVLTEEEWEEYSINRRTPNVELREDWDDVVNLLEQYAQVNYPNEFNGYEEYCYCKDNITILDDFDYENIYIIQQPKKRTAKKRKAVTKKKRSTLKLEEVNVYHNFVKVGWNVYNIWLNEDEDEYVKIENKIYWIDRDNNGNTKLSVQ